MSGWSRWWARCTWAYRSKTGGWPVCIGWMWRAWSRHNKFRTQNSELRTQKAESLLRGIIHMNDLRMRRFWLVAFAVVMAFAVSAPLARAADDKEKGATPLEDEM